MLHFYNILYHNLHRICCHFVHFLITCMFKANITMKQAGILYLPQAVSLGLLYYFNFVFKSCLLPMKLNIYAKKRIQIEFWVKKNSWIEYILTIPSKVTNLFLISGLLIAVNVSAFKINVFHHSIFDIKSNMSMSM